MSRLLEFFRRKSLRFLRNYDKKRDNFSFRSMMKKLENRFGSKEITETERVKFQQTSQQADETLKDWADRGLTLATPAFKHLPENHRLKETISKFCQGCIDKEAAKHACFEHPKSMQAALNAVKYHQYISQAVEGKKLSSRKKEDITVNTVVSPSEARVEEMIAKAIDSLAAKLQKLEKITSMPQKSNAGLQCFF